MIYIFLALFIALFVVMLILSAFFSAISTVLSWLGLTRRKNVSSYSDVSGQGKGNGKEQAPHAKKERGKLFADDEGEYVDFEEIK